jgi:hypothetical protein
LAGLRAAAAKMHNLAPGLAVPVMTVFALSKEKGGFAHSAVRMIWGEDGSGVANRAVVVVAQGLIDYLVDAVDDFAGVDSYPFLNSTALIV